MGSRTHHAEKRGLEVCPIPQPGIEATEPVRHHDDRGLVAGRAQSFMKYGWSGWDGRPAPRLVM